MRSLDLMPGFQQPSLVGTKPGVAAATVRSEDPTQGNQDLCEPRKETILVMEGEEV